MRTVETKIRLWNPVIASLTIMVMGTSAPQILLVLIEAFQTVGYLQRIHVVESPQKDLIGPSVIFGSAAFNTFFVTAVCVYAPNPANDTVRLYFLMGLTRVLRETCKLNGESRRLTTTAIS